MGGAKIMIIYFSGTGNSHFVANYLAEKTNEVSINVADINACNFESGWISSNFNLSPGERLGIVFPIHSWGPPKFLLDIIDNITLNFREKPFCYAIATCGKNAGNAMKVIDKHLLSKGLKLDNAYTLVMPNNYIIFGDIYPKEKQERLLNQAKIEIEKISLEIYERQSGIFRIEKGTLPFILTGVFNKAFNSAPNRAAKFYHTDACTGCGTCEKVCPCHNIIVDKNPTWGSNCSQCLACIHHCPERAIEYGKSTVNKGRYTNPDI